MRVFLVTVSWQDPAPIELMGISNGVRDMLRLASSNKSFLKYHLKTLLKVALNLLGFQVELREKVTWKLFRKLCYWAQKGISDPDSALTHTGFTPA